MFMHSRGINWVRAIGALLLAAVVLIAVRAGKALAFPPPPPTVTVSSINLNPTSVIGGSTSSATVYLAAVPTSAVTVTISTNNGATAPATVTVPTTVRYATFTVSTAAVTTDATATITCTVGSSSANASLSIAAPTLSAMTVNPASVGGGTNATGTVTLSGVAPTGGKTVNLSSDKASDTYPITVPSSVTVAAGARTATFLVSSVARPTDATANISAVIGSGTAITKQLTVTAPVLNSLVINPSTINSGQTSPGTVTLVDNAPTGGMTVNLSSNASYLTVPSTVSIPAGSKIGTFLVTSYALPTDSTGTVTASLNSANKTANLTVHAATVTQLTINPSSVYAGASTSGTVYISNNAPPSGVTVTLSSDNSCATVPTTVTIPGGVRYKAFTISTPSSTTSGSANITATFGASSVSSSLSVSATTLYGVNFFSHTVFGGNQVLGKVSLYGVAPTGGAVISLSSDSAGFTVPATVTIPAGLPSAYFLANGNLVSSSTAATVTASFRGTTGTSVVTTLPGWPQQRANAAGTGIGLGSGATSNTQWTVAGADQSGGLSIGPDGTIYTVLDYSNITAINPNGTIKWTYAIGGTPMVPTLGPDGTIYCVGGSSYVVALNPNGTLKWYTDLPCQDIYNDSPTAYGLPAITIGADGTVIAMSGDFYWMDLYGTIQSDANLWGLDPANGNIRWLKSNIPGLGQLTTGPDGALFMALNPGENNPGSVLRKVDPSSGYVYWEAYFNGYASVTVPKVAGDNVLVGETDAGDGNGLFRVDYWTGNKISCTNFNGGVSGPVTYAADNTMYVPAGDGTLVAVNPDGTTKWTSTVGNLRLTGAIISGDGTIYTLAYDGTLSAINPSTGVHYWDKSTSNAGSAIALGVDGTIYVRTSTGVFAIK